MNASASKRIKPAAWLSGERCADTAEPTDALRHLVSWQIASPLSRAIFLQEMHGVYYSPRLVVIAWTWFSKGRES